MDKNIEEKVINPYYGTRDTGEKVKRSVYKVRRGGTGADKDVYDRVHFETDSKMVHDATETVEPNMIARRDATGSIQFKDIKGTGNTNIDGTLYIKGTSTLNGKMTANNGAEIINGLTIDNVVSHANFLKNIYAKENIIVDKLSTLKGEVRAGSDVSITGNLNLKGNEIRTEGASNGSLVLSAENENLHLRSKKIDPQTGGELILGHTKMTVSKPIEVTGNVTSSAEVLAGTNIYARNGQLKVTKSGLLTTLSTETTNSFDINTGAPLVKTNKPFMANGDITASGAKVTAGRSLHSPSLTISRGIIIDNNNKIKFEADNNATGFYFNKPIFMESGSAVSTNLNADKVDGCDVNNSVVTDSNLWTAKKVDDTKANKTTTISAGEGLTGGGNLGGNRTITHGTPGVSVASMGITKLTEVIKMIHYDKFGHVVRLETYDMDKTFATPEQVADAIANSDKTVKNSFLVHTELNPDGTVKGPARNTVNNVNMKNYSIDYSTAGGGCIQFTFV